MKNNYSRYNCLFLFFFTITIAYGADKKDEEMRDARSEPIFTNLMTANSLSGNDQNEKTLSLDMIKACTTIGIVSDFIVEFEKVFALPSKAVSSSNQNKRRIQEATEIIRGEGIDPVVNSKLKVHRMAE